MSGWVTPVVSSADAHVSFGFTATRLPRTKDSTGKCRSASAIACSIASFRVMTTVAIAWSSKKPVGKASVISLPVCPPRITHGPRAW